MLLWDENLLQIASWNYPACVGGANNGAVILLALFLGNILGHLTPSEHHLNATPFLAADQKHLFMAAVYPFSIGHLQQNNELCYKASIISASFQGNHNDFSLLNWPGISPAQHL